MQGMPPKMLRRYKNRGLKMKDTFTIRLSDEYKQAFLGLMAIECGQFSQREFLEKLALVFARKRIEYIRESIASAEAEVIISQGKFDRLADMLAKEDGALIEKSNSDVKNASRILAQNELELNELRDTLKKYVEVYNKLSKREE
jgi:hypothetical protein